MSKLNNYRELFNQSIAKKFILYIFIFSAVITIILTTIQLYNDYRQGLKVIENNISIVEASHLDSIINTLWVSDLELLVIQLKGMFKLSDMQHLQITDHGKIIAEVGTIQNEHTISKSFALTHKYDDNIMSLGTLQVTFTLTELYNRLFTDAVVIAITHAVKTLLVSFFIFIIFYHLVGKHLVTMSHYAATLSLDPSDSPLSLNRCSESKAPNDELETVVIAINKMRENLIKKMSHQLHVEENLRQSQELLKFATEGASLGIWDRDLVTKTTYFNPLYFTMLGYDPDELPHSHATYQTLIHPDDRQFVNEEIKKCIEQDRAWKMEFRLRNKNGQYNWILGCGKVVKKDAAGQPIRATGIHLDISEGKNLLEERQKVTKLESIGILAGGIAHDFNNILSAILGNIELASYRVENTDAKTFSLLSNAQKATKRAAKLTRQLLTFSKGGDPIIEKTPLMSLVRESAEFVLHGSQVSCEYIFPEDLWMVVADSGQLGQVIQNIVLNAKQGMPDGGKIEIRCSNIGKTSAESNFNNLDGDFVHITIQDTGTGIPPESINRIFDPYFTTKSEGSGLGLAICHSIINKHGGSISVQSSDESGTTLSIYIPAERSDDDRVVEQQDPEQVFRPTSVMVMDDEEMLRNVAKAQLQALGHSAILVADGEQAINQYQKLYRNGTPVDLVILDLTIPGAMGGKEAAKELLLIDKDAKIIVASGYSNDPVMADYMDYGFCSAIAKPFDLQDLNNAIISAMKSP